jgi:hypothetical protein
VYTSKPNDFTRFSVAARTAASSSTIEITALLLNRHSPLPGREEPMRRLGPSNSCGEYSVSIGCEHHT